MKLVYLAVPYSDPDPSVRERRFQAANEAAGILMRAGLYVYSPISHSHPIAIAGGLPLDWDYWEGYDREILSHCGALVVLEIAGWRESTGVTGELKISADFCIPAMVLTADEMRNARMQARLRTWCEIPSEAAERERINILDKAQ